MRRVLTGWLALAVFFPMGSHAADEKEPVHKGRPLSEWVARLKDKSDPARWEAAFELGNLGAAAAPAVPALIEALKDESKGCRSHAIKALGKIGPGAKAAVPASQTL
jgi:hypothetical protein